MRTYQQCDPRWGLVDYSTSGERTDICESGCGPTSMAMVLATWVDPAITPQTTAEWSKAHEFKALRQGTYYSYFAAQAKAYGLKAYQLNGRNLRKRPDPSMHFRVLEELQKGNAVIACMGQGLWTRRGHYILLTDVDVAKDIAYVNDPASTDPARTRGSWKRFTQEVKYYFIVEKPRGGEKMTENREKPSEWAKDTWDTAKRNKIFDGTRPHDPLTREEAAAVIVRALRMAGVKLE